MRELIISPSSLDTYLNCPRAFFHYKQRTPKRPTNNYKVGSCFHLGMEAYVDAQYELPYEEALHNILYEQNQTFPPNVIQETVEVANKWLKSPKNPLPLPEQIHATEASFGPPGTDLGGKPVKAEITFETGLRLRGIIDLIWIDNGNTIVVVDYKTQKTWMTNEELATKVQAMAYALVINKINPNLPIRVEFHLVRYPDRDPVTWIPQDDDFEFMENLLFNYYRQIKSDRSFEPEPSINCRWCNWNYLCEAYKEWCRPVKENGVNKSLWDVMTPEEIAAELDFFYDIEKASETTVKDLKEKLQLIMERDNLEQVGRWSFNRKARSEYRPEVAHIVAQFKGKKMPDDVKAQIKPYKRLIYGKPYLQCDWRQKSGQRRKN